MTIVADQVIDLTRHNFYPVRLHYPIFSGHETRCSCGSPDCKGSIGKHPVASAWGKTATQDEDIIREQWQNPWNVGIVLGPCHGIPADHAIVDIEDDTPEGREFAESLGLGVAHGYPCPTYTSGKSLHRIFRWTPDLPESWGKATLTISGLEFRFGGHGKQSQSVAPPSVHQNGSEYRWVDGMSPDDIPIIPLPQHVIDLTRKASAERASKQTGLPGSTDVRKFRSPQGKLGVGARHHSLLIYANSLWRYAFQIWGINCVDDEDAVQQVWMWLASGNQYVCDPPKTESEVNVIFKSAQSFMYGEFCKELEEKQKLITPDSPEWNRSLEHFLQKHGIRLVPDPALDPTTQDAGRIDEWQCDWKMKYVTKGDEDLTVVEIRDWQIAMDSLEFAAPASFARKVQQETGGEFFLNQTFPMWNWKTIWEGQPNDKKKANGITRGLKEFLTRNAAVEEKKENGISDQIEDIIIAMIGNKDELVAGLQVYREHNHKFQGRMKIVPGGGLTEMKDKDDPATGYYFDGTDIWLLVKLDEVSRRHRSAFGGTINSRQIQETLEALRFEKKQFRRGPMAGRWFARVEKNEE